MSDPKALVRRLVDDAINAGDLAALDDIASPALARALRRAFDQFRDAFPDWRQEIVELVAEGDTVVAHFRCTGTHRGAWQGLPPTGRTMLVDEVFFFRVERDRLHRAWGLEDTWTRYRQLQGDAARLGRHGSLDHPTTWRARALPGLSGRGGQMAGARAPRESDRSRRRGGGRRETW